MTTNLETEAEKVGLKISAEKTKVMQIGGGRAPHSITVGLQTVDDVERFTYLGSVMTEDRGAEADVNCRVGKAASVFQRLRPIWTSCVVSTATKIWLYNSIVVSVTSYASETWKMAARTEHKLNVFHQRCFRKILSHIQRPHYKRGNLALVNSRNLSDIVTERRFRMAGQILRLTRSSSGESGNILDSSGWQAYNRTPAPKKTWRRTFQQDLQTVDFK